MSNIVSVLRDFGMSYTTIAKVAGASVMEVKAAKKDPEMLSAEGLDRLERLARHYVVLGENLANSQMEPATFFEEQILICKREDGSEAWAYVHDLWVNGVLTDEMLVLKTSEATYDTAYFMSDLLEDYPLEYNVVPMPDGQKSIVVDIPLPKVDFSKDKVSILD